MTAQVAATETGHATITAVLFDKDGTLFDFGATWEGWARAFLLRATGNDLNRAIFVGHQIGFDVEAHAFRPDSIVIADTPDNIASALAPHFPGRSCTDLLTLLNEEAALATQVEAVPLLPLLGRLRAQGLKLGVATNDAEAPALAHLNAAGILNQFDFVAGSDSGHGAKPGTGQMMAFADAVAVTPDRIVMVGDSTHDLVAGRAAGMKTVGVLTGIAGAEDLAPFADAVFPDIGHLLDWLAA